MSERTKDFSLKWSDLSKEDRAYFKFDWIVSCIKYTFLTILILSIFSVFLNIMVATILDAMKNNENYLNEYSTLRN